MTSSVLETDATDANQQGEIYSNAPGPDPEAGGAYPKGWGEVKCSHVQNCARRWALPPSLADILFAIPRGFSVLCWAAFEK